MCSARPAVAPYQCGILIERNFRTWPCCAFLLRSNSGAERRDRAVLSCCIAMTHRSICWRRTETRKSAIEIAKYDDAGNYRPLKTAPNLRHGWRLELATVEELRRALDYFYPGRLAVFAAWKSGYLKTTALRETLDRQSGMYRVAAKISDPQINDLVADFCRSDSGCLRTILWKCDRNGVIASTKLPKEKFDPVYDQVMASASPCGRRARFGYSGSCGYSSVALPGSVQSSGRRMPESRERRKTFNL